MDGLTRRWRASFARSLLHFIESLYEINTSLEAAADYLRGKIRHLQEWARVFVSADPPIAQHVIDKNDAKAGMTVNKLLELEERVWSPMYGLKGNIDATVQVMLQSKDDVATSTLTIPLEFKTGRSDGVANHRAQTQLYTLLLSDRYDVEVTCGVLYYLETSKNYRIAGVRQEIRQMIIQRNELACYVKDKLQLPPMIKNERMCKSCYARTTCFTYHRLSEGGNAESSGAKEAFNNEVSHLTSKHEVFFKKWDELLTKEERDAMKFKRELWTMLSTEREGVGRCFGNVIIEPGSAKENLDGPKINRFQYSFIRSQGDTGLSFTESQLTIGEPIVISDEKGHFALAIGYITQVRPTRVTVIVDRKLQNVRKKCIDFHPKTNQSFNGIMEVTHDGTPAPTDPANPTLYRIDKDEFSNGMATARNNIIRIMEKDLFRARELRELIVEGHKPRFHAATSRPSLSGKVAHQQLNVDQHRAINKVKAAQDYALILGMPGTGKTTTIAYIINELVARGKSVLLTSYTHTAVDNILLKLKDDNIPILRLGPVSKVHSEVQQFAELAAVPKTSMAELEKSYSESMVVATTCLGINHAIFSARAFDYCIVDEASQITLPVCLGPIRMAHRFILVGDHFQLPPLVQNKEAQEGGLDISLFKLLSEAHPEAVTDLEHQYRMAADIMHLANTLIYNGRLKCGTPQIAEQMLGTPAFESGLAAHHQPFRGSMPSSNGAQCSRGTVPSCWIASALSPQHRALFLNTDRMGDASVEKTSGQRITNPFESILIAQMITVLIRSGISPRSIGVVAIYRSQRALLRRDVKALAGTNAAAEVEIDTADKLQGRDKEVVIISCVRSNNDKMVGDLLRDWRRVNVAITRARSKLLIVGSRSTLAASNVPVLENLIDCMAAKHWIYELPISAADNHLFDTGRTQTQTQTQAKIRPSAAPSRDNVASAPRSHSGRHALSSSSGNTNQALAMSAQKGGVNRTASLPPFRQPARVVRGAGTMDMQKLLDRNPILRDVVNEV